MGTGLKYRWVVTFADGTVGYTWKATKAEAMNGWPKGRPVSARRITEADYDRSLGIK